MISYHYMPRIACLKGNLDDNALNYLLLELETNHNLWTLQTTLAVNNPLGEQMDQLEYACMIHKNLLDVKQQFKDRMMAINT